MYVKSIGAMISLLKRIAWSSTIIQVKISHGSIHVRGNCTHLFLLILSTIIGILLFSIFAFLASTIRRLSHLLWSKCSEVVIRCGKWLNGVPLWIILLHAQLDLSDRHHILSSSDSLLEVLVNDGGCPQIESCCLVLDETADEYRSKDELKEYEAKVDKDETSFMRVVHCLHQWYDRHGCNEEDREDLECDQLWEGLIDISFVAKIESWQLQREPGEDEYGSHLVDILRIGNHKFVHIGQAHQECIQEIECSMVEEQLLECQWWVEWDL